MIQSITLHSRLDEECDRVVSDYRVCSVIVQDVGSSSISVCGGSVFSCDTKVSGNQHNTLNAITDVNDTIANAIGLLITNINQATIW
jgi:hypothetical protein